MPSSGARALNSVVSGCSPRHGLHSSSELNRRTVGKQLMVKVHNLGEVLQECMAFSQHLGSVLAAGLSPPGQVVTQAQVFGSCPCPSGHESGH